MTQCSRAQYITGQAEVTLSRAPHDCRLMGDQRTRATEWRSVIQLDEHHHVRRIAQAGSHTIDERLLERNDCPSTDRSQWQTRTLMAVPDHPLKHGHSRQQGRKGGGLRIEDTYSDLRVCLQMPCRKLCCSFMWSLDRLGGLRANADTQLL
jgi:hypothetical protein